jgi:hypothetical protein
MYRVCRDLLLHVQPRLWPPDVLFWDFRFRPKKSKKNVGITQTPTLKWCGLIRLGRATVSIMSSDEAPELSGSAELTKATVTAGASCEVNGVCSTTRIIKTGVKL